VVVKVATELPIAAELACGLAQKPTIFKHVEWPVFTIGNLPVARRNHCRAGLSNGPWESLAMVSVERETRLLCRWLRGPPG